MNLDLLKSFVAVAEARSLSGASRATGTSQPALSRNIGRLEAELGTPVFERYGRHVECTVGGELLLPLAQAIINRTDEAVAIIREHAGGGLSSVRFGAPGGVFARLLTPHLASFSAAYPTVEISLLERDDASLEEAVVSGELDCAVFTPWGAARAATVHLLTEPLLLVVAASHPLASAAAATLEMLAGESILLPPSTVNTGNIVVDAFRKAGIEPRFSFRANYPELTQALVRKDLGVAIMPQLHLPPDVLHGLAAIPFAKPFTRDLVLLSPRDRPLPAAARALMGHIKAGIGHPGR